MLQKDIRNNYIVINGWMVQNLRLHGNELLCFAIIHGFCQDEETEFTGSISYLCEWLNCSRPTVSKCLANLVDKNLIQKNIVIVNQVTFNRYKINWGVVKKLYGGSKETLQGGSKEFLWGGSKETLHHNTILDNTNINNSNDNTSISEIEFEENSDLKIENTKEKSCAKKEKYKPNVELTKIEHFTLGSEFGNDIRDAAIQYLSDYKIEKGYKTKSDYLTIRRWVIDAVKKQNLNNGAAFNQNTASLANKSRLDVIKEW